MPVFLYKSLEEIAQEDASSIIPRCSEAFEQFTQDLVEQMKTTAIQQFIDQKNEEIVDMVTYHLLSDFGLLMAGMLAYEVNMVDEEKQLFIRYVAKAKVGSTIYYFAGYSEQRGFFDAVEPSLAAKTAICDAFDTSINKDHF